MSDQIHVVPLARLRVAATNARKDTAGGQEDANLDGLAQSIREHGLLNPPTVRVLADGTYEVLAGPRRYLACKALGLTEIPVLVREGISDTRAVALSLVENVQRADMHPVTRRSRTARPRVRREGGRCGWVSRATASRRGSLQGSRSTNRHTPGEGRQTR